MLIKDKKIATRTSSIGAAEGTPKFHKNTPINHIM
jgi:hypothetical protein